MEVFETLEERLDVRAPANRFSAIDGDLSIAREQCRDPTVVHSKDQVGVASGRFPDFLLGPKQRGTYVG